MARGKRGGSGGGGGGGHDAGGSMRWLLTYADMITLLMAFFIMMYSMSVLNMAKFQEVAFSIRSGFGGMLKGGAHVLKYQTNKQRGRTRHDGANTSSKQKLKEVEMELTSFSISNDLQDAMTVTREVRGLVVSIVVDGLLYQAGSATLNPAASRVLDEISTELQRVPNDIAVEGHTCTSPINTAIFPSNWELSAARACSVIRYLQGRGIESERMHATGFGETQPRLPNDTEQHRRLNRRVNIVILTSPFEAETSASTSLPNQTVVPGGAAPDIRPIIRKVWQGKDETQGGITP